MAYTREDKSVLTPLGFSLLRQLSDGAFHSGEDLAAKVGLTRARVSQVLKDAENAGLALERIKGEFRRVLGVDGSGHAISKRTGPTHATAGND